MAKFKTKIRPKSGLLDVGFNEIWSYRDLFFMFVRRNIITVYKQTILGPIWFLIQPILTTGMYVLVFGKIANISTDGMPHVLFYLSGVVIWSYFSDSFIQISNTFTANANIFGKVYFPRLIVPFAEVASGLVKFFIQFVFFIAIYIYFYTAGNSAMEPNWTLSLIPLYILLMAILGLSSGLIFSSLTTKYRDLKHLLTFGVQLMMYATPVIYPVSSIPEKYQFYILLNPLTPILEGFKYAFLGVGHFSYDSLLYSVGFTFTLLLFGLIIFHQTERSFIDTV